MTDVQRFLERFADFGGAPDPDKYESLFDPVDGTVLHPGMTAPLHRDHVRAYEMKSRRISASAAPGVVETGIQCALWPRRV